MGKLLETTYHDSIEKITKFHSPLINNPFYSLSDKKPSIVTYYNINKEASSLDPGSKISYDNIGKDTSIRFNKILDFMIYGFNKVELNTENDEYGLEADKISGECYILPNTIKPTEGDYFEVEHITDSTWLFIVTDVQQDTLENGSNVYKIVYKLEYVDHNRILNNVVKTYRMIEQREGTNIAKVVEDTKYTTAKQMDNFAVKLKHVFNELFYNPYVQTFIFEDLTDWRIYDPYMIEFLIRNKILDNGNDSYIYVCHQLEKSKTFGIEYEDTFFRAFELADKDKLIKSKRNFTPIDIHSYGTTFSSRFEPYYEADYKDSTSVYVRGYQSNCIPDELLYRIMDHNLYQNININDPQPIWENILIKYFYNEDFTEEEIKSIDNLKYEYAINMFYTIPLLILCLETAIEKALK